MSGGEDIHERQSCSRSSTPHAPISLTAQKEEEIENKNKNKKKNKRKKRKEKKQKKR